MTAHACQQSLLFTSLGLLLLLLYMFSSEVPNFQTRSLNFVCDVRGGCHGERLVDCSGSDQLPSSLQLPCVRILKPSWHHKSVSQKHAEVRGALGCCWTVCQSSLLERLLHGITNYLHIVTNLDITVRRTDRGTHTHTLTLFHSCQLSLFLSPNLPSQTLDCVHCHALFTTVFVCLDHDSLLVM
uniref:Uncharacterized protein n=1 Tax=Oncorhynchus tshawytscha TaxID=74940 RepID=A0A8C8JI51_ONCTS